MDPAGVDAAVAEAANLIRDAEAIVIGAGAGMGVDSGLPDFRGPEGFWRAYPAFKGRQFSEMSNPYWFDRDPELAWGFFGHRLQLYRDTPPHAGFWILKTWMDSKLLGGFVVTSNVDGQFSKAGFDPERIVEIHGSIHHLQCVKRCGRTSDIWPEPGLTFDIDEAVRTCSPLPRCPGCGALARPNVLMFGDYGWIGARSNQQRRRFETWMRTVRQRRIAVVELGAGTAIPSIRMACESLAEQVIRINPRDPDGPIGTVSIPLGALEGLRRIDTLL